MGAYEMMMTLIVLIGSIVIFLVISRYRKASALNLEEDGKAIATELIYVNRHPAHLEVGRREKIGNTGHADRSSEAVVDDTDAGKPR